jgi:hypothetical protein
MTDLADEEKEVKAARSLVQHPVKTIHDMTAGAYPAKGQEQDQDDDANGSGARHKRYAREESTWRRTHMAAAEARVEAKERDQEASMARLRQTLSRDRDDLQQARDELKRSAADVKGAKKEEAHAAEVKQRAAQERLHVEAARVREVGLRRMVLHELARSRARRTRMGARQEHTVKLDGTLDKVWLQAHRESSQAMRLRSDALKVRVPKEPCKRALLHSSETY